MALVTRLTGKLLHFLKLTEVPRDKTQFRLLIGPKVLKGKKSQLKLTLLNNSNLPTSLRVYLARHSARRGDQSFITYHANISYLASIRDTFMYFIF